MPKTRKTRKPGSQENQTQTRGLHQLHQERKLTGVIEREVVVLGIPHGEFGVLVAEVGGIDEFNSATGGGFGFFDVNVDGGDVLERDRA